MRLNRHLSSRAATALCVVVGWGALILSGCLADGAGGDPSDGSPDAGTPGDPSLDGAALYESKGCVTCHGPLATSQKRNATFARIRAAAGPDSQIAPMRGIILTDDEIRALVVALADASTPGAADRRRPLAKPLLLTRTEVASRLISIFGPVEGVPVDEELILERVFAYVERQATFFGGHCNRYDGCEAAEIAATQNPATSTVRAGILIRTCLDILATPNADATVLAKAMLTPSEPVSAANVRAVWDVFAPGRPIADATVNQVIAAAEPNQPWATVLQLFCRPSVLEAI